MTRFTTNLDTREGFYYVWDAVNVRRVGDGKGGTLTFPREVEADTVREEMSARVAMVSTFNAPEPRLPRLPRDSDNDGGYDPDDYQDLPALLSATSVTMRGLFG